MKRNLEAELDAARKEVKQLQELVDLKTKYRQLAEQLGMDKWPVIPQIPYVPFVPIPCPYPVYPQPAPIYPRPWNEPYIIWGKTETVVSTNQLKVSNGNVPGVSVSII